jgi:uncharacterized protein (TIGR02996 family)
MNEDGFLRAILADPADDAALLVYADWLEEQGDPTAVSKAEFLRLTVDLAGAPTGTGSTKVRRKRLGELAASLDTDWLAVVSRLPVENCLTKRTEGEVRSQATVLQFVCDRRWEDLQPTDEGVRFCTGCGQSVYYCDTIVTARQHAEQGHCIAIDLGIMRCADDFAPVHSARLLGRPSPELLRRDLERLLPDPVSRECERKKQGNQGAS